MTLNELMTQLLQVLPEMQVGEDNDGQIVVYTGLTTNVENDELEEMPS